MKFDVLCFFRCHPDIVAQFDDSNDVVEPLRMVHAPETVYPPPAPPIHVLFTREEVNRDVVVQPSSNTKKSGLFVA